jgi:signal peptidase
MLLPAIAGFDRYVITGGSMSGTYDRGSIAYAKAVPVDELRVGDVITYEPPPGAPDGLVTHRIVSIREDRRGEPVFRTKGDANASRDPWTFTLDEQVQARVEFSVPYVGYAFSALAVREVRMGLIGVPALLIALALATRMWREAGETSRRIDRIAAGEEPL